MQKYLVNLTINLIVAAGITWGLTGLTAITFGAAFASVFVIVVSLDLLIYASTKE